jgi:hypothetical protein
MPSFTDAEFMLAKEKEKAWKNFKKIIDARDISLLKETLYKHCHIHCSFIAHYNRHGFIAEYSGQNFRRFVEHFDRNSKYNGPGCMNATWMRVEDYKDLNELMVNYCTLHAPQIYAELDEQIRQVEIALLKRLAEKHGFIQLEEAINQKTSKNETEQMCLF